jgi:uracil-DNA glycosylase
VLPLPHPSWRNSGWIKKNPWFEAELLPELKWQEVLESASEVRKFPSVGLCGIFSL